MYFDPLGLQETFTLGGGGTLAGFLFGLSGNISAKFTIPDDIFDFGCYQAGISGAINPLIGGGVYLGVDPVWSKTHSDGPLQPGWNGGIDPYAEAGAGMVVSLSGSISMADNNLTMGTSIPNPIVGFGFGAYAMGGYSYNFSWTSETYKDDCECKQ